MLVGKSWKHLTRFHRHLLVAVFSCWWSPWLCQCCTSGLSSTKRWSCPSGLEPASRYEPPNSSTPDRRLCAVTSYAACLHINFQLRMLSAALFAGTLSPLGHPDLQLYNRRLVSTSVLFTGVQSDEQLDMWWRIPVTFFVGLWMSWRAIWWATSTSSSCSNIPWTWEDDACSPRQISCECLNERFK